MKFFSLDNIFATITVVFTLAFLSIIFTIDFLDPVQNAIEDFNSTDIVFSQIRDYDEYPADTNIVLVNIGYLPREGIAAQINILNYYQPKVIGIDLFFRNPKEEENDLPLAAALANCENIVLVSKPIFNKKTDKFDTMETSHEMFNQFVETGFANLITDDDESFRTVKNVVSTINVKDTVEPVFGAKLVEYYAPDKTEIFFDKYDSDDEIFVNVKRNIDKYTTLDVADVFKKRDSLHFIKDKIVIMGFLGPDLTTPVTEDVFFTLMNKQYMGKTYPDMYGVVFHANLASMIINEDYIYSVPHTLKMIITILLIYLNMGIFSLIIAKFPERYEPFNLLIIMVELVVLFLIMAGTLHFLNFEINLTEAALFGLIFAATGFEIYHGVIKPASLRLTKRIQTLLGSSKKT